MSKQKTDKPIDAAFRAARNNEVWSEAAYSGALSAFRRRYTRDLKNVDAVLWGVPFDLATSYRPGTRFGPQAIRRISAMWEPADAAWPYDFSPFEKMSIIDYGDAAFDFTKSETAFNDIVRQASKILESGASLYSMGGDHSISHPLLRAHAEKYGKLAFIHFDAHPDTWSNTEKDLYHGNFVSFADEDGLIDPKASIQIGIRTVAPNPHKIEQISADECFRLGVDKVAAKIKKRIGKRKAYLSFDIDTLDPAYAPGTGTPVPGGLSTREAYMILRGLEGIDIVGADIVEVSPAYDHADLAANAAAGVLQQLLCLQALRMKKR
ncbi:MAG: agmatinase [Pseudomonadota bacterium]